MILKGVCEFCGATTVKATPAERDTVKAMAGGVCYRCKRPITLRPGRGLKGQMEAPVRNRFHPEQQ